MKTTPENSSSQQLVLSKHLNTMQDICQSYFSGKRHNIYNPLLSPQIGRKKLQSSITLMFKQLLGTQQPPQVLFPYYQPLPLPNLTLERLSTNSISSLDVTDKNPRDPKIQTCYYRLKSKRNMVLCSEVSSCPLLQVGSQGLCNHIFSSVFG